MWSGRRLTKRQATSRPDHLWPEVWRSVSRNSKMKERKNWATEKPKSENARRVRGIYFIEARMKDLKKTHGKKLEVQAAPAMPCKSTTTGKPLALNMSTSQN